MSASTNPSRRSSRGQRVKTLAVETRADNARFFDDVDEVPHHVVTQGIGTILDPRHVILIATGETKAAPIQRAVEGPLTAMCPASALQLHPRATVVIDEAAAADLTLTDYYRDVAGQTALAGLVIASSGFDGRDK